MWMCSEKEETVGKRQSSELSPDGILNKWDKNSLNNQFQCSASSWWKPKSEQMWNNKQKMQKWPQKQIDGIKTAELFSVVLSAKVGLRKWETISAANKRIG